MSREVNDSIELAYEKFIRDGKEKSEEIALLSEAYVNFITASEIRPRTDEEILTLVEITMQLYKLLDKKYIIYFVADCVEYIYDEFVPQDPSNKLEEFVNTLSYPQLVSKYNDYYYEEFLSLL